MQESKQKRILEAFNTFIELRKNSISDVSCFWQAIKKHLPEESPSYIGEKIDNNIELIKRAILLSQSLKWDRQISWDEVIALLLDLKDSLSLK